MSSPVNTILERPGLVAALVSLGSNLDSAAGTSRETLEAALRALQALSSEPLLRSSLYLTAPIDCEPGSRDFINAAACLWRTAGSSALALLHALQAIEADFGRQRAGGVNAARTLDLDLISFGELCCSGEELVLPHPRASQRRFVLEPLVELAPELQLPGQGLTIKQLLENLGETQHIRRLCASN